jgi:ATP-dependent Clp protease ATP-binding subunit ClpA
MRPAEPYLIAAAEEARRRGHGYVGTEHLLLVLVRGGDGGAVPALRRLGVSRDAVEDALAPLVPPSTSTLDADALATLGIDLDAVRQRLEETFGAGALERTRTACLGVCPRVKRALAHTVDRADDRPVRDEDVLLGLLSVSDSVAARVLAGLGISVEAVEAAIADPA